MMMPGATQLHYSIATPIRNNGSDAWDFSCPLCAYHARYYKPTGQGDYSLEIINAGESLVRHVSAQGEPAGRIDSTFRAAGLIEDSEEETWLTPHLRAQIYEILKKYEFD
jgi:hypothetical protein